VDLRLLARGALVIDKDKIIRYVEHVPEVTQLPDYDKVLEVVNALL
jgi:thiol peroxidase